jgi:hypothetical protein
MHNMFGPQAKQVFEFLDGVPELRTRSVRIHHQVLVPQVFIPKDLQPQALLARVEPPYPLDQQESIHEACIDDT